MRNRTINILGTLFVIIMVIVVIILIESQNPLRKPIEEIRESMLELTPIGTSIEDVLKVVESNKKWMILQDGIWAPWPSDHNNITALYINSFIETKSIRVLIGKYKNFFNVSVNAYWKFDDKLKVIDILVNKEGGGF